MSHPITPPPELVAAWCRETDDSEPMFPQVAAKAAQWGADQELEACCALLDKFNDGFWCDELRAARRPKQPSLKEQALEEADTNLHDLLIEQDELLAKLSDLLRSIGLNKPALDADAAVERLHNFLAQADQAKTNIERERQEAADQELEECCQFFARDLRESLAAELRAARRPEPPILKEQALADLVAAYDKGYLSTAHYENVRRALEQLDD